MLQYSIKCRFKSNKTVSHVQHSHANVARDLLFCLTSEVLRGVGRNFGGGLMIPVFRGYLAQCEMQRNPHSALKKIQGFLSGPPPPPTTNTFSINSKL